MSTPITLVRYRAPFIESEHERPEDCCQTGKEECPEARILLTENVSTRVLNAHSHAAYCSPARRATRVASPWTRHASGGCGCEHVIDE